ncbi:MAG: hypothetical protein IT442_10530 [Phycisphaeraceae bacterium]|nr:hypothetical protein [Phycisphaeraceae bacterium]
MVRWAFFTAVLLVLAAGSLAQPVGLEPSETEQLGSAVDRSARLDEAAIYPLLRGAAAAMCDVEAPPEANLAALMADPSGHRGERYRISGRLTAMPRPVGEMAQPGPWDGRLTQWVLTAAGQEAPVIVYVVGDTDWGNLRSGRRVSFTGWFYKIWSTPDLEGRTRDYLAFVAPAAAMNVPAEPKSRGGSWLALPALAVLIVGVLALRRYAASWARGSKQTTSPPDASTAAGYDHDLPADPAAALAELERRRQQPRPTTKEPGSSTDHDHADR